MTQIQSQAKKGFPPKKTYSERANPYSTRPSSSPKPLCRRTGHRPAHSVSLQQEATRCQGHQRRDGGGHRGHAGRTQGAGGHVMTGSRGQGRVERVGAGEALCVGGGGGAGSGEGGRRHARAAGEGGEAARCGGRGRRRRWWRGGERPQGQGFVKQEEVRRCVACIGIKLWLDLCWCGRSSSSCGWCELVCLHLQAASPNP